MFRIFCTVCHQRVRLWKLGPWWDYISHEINNRNNPLLKTRKAKFSLLLFCSWQIYFITNYNNILLAHNFGYVLSETNALPIVFLFSAKKDSKADDFTLLNYPEDPVERNGGPKGECWICR